MSLSISEADDGKVLFKCFYGCSQDEVIDALTALGLFFRARSRSWNLPSAPSAPSAPAADRPEDVERAEAAIGIWHKSQPAAGTLVETYLEFRGLKLPSDAAALRHHPRLWHPGDERRWPAMVALVTDVDDAPLGIHRTFLARDGQGKAPVEPNKMMLGPCGGGAVRLRQWRQGQPLMVGEGVETCLAAMQVIGSPTWAALSTSGLRKLILPAGIQDIIILADGDDPGEAAAVAAGQRWRREGRNVRIARPPAGQDFADMLIAGEQVR